MSENRVLVRATGNIDEADVPGFDHDGKSYRIYNTPEGFHATDGIRTHEDERLDGGIVIGCVIECPLHHGRFDVRTGDLPAIQACVGSSQVEEGISGFNANRMPVWQGR